MPFNLQDPHLVTLAWDEPFLAAISRQMPKKAYPKEQIPTIAMIYNKRSGDFSIGYSEEFMETKSEKEVRGLLKHELYHFLFNHLGTTSRGSNAQFQTKEQIEENIAMDLAINSLIPEDQLPEGAYIPGMTGEGVLPIFTSLPKGESYEWYADKLKNDEEFQNYMESLPKKYVGDHSHWGSAAEDTRRIVKKAINEIEKAGSAEERAKKWGSVPAELREQLYATASNSVDWRDVLARFIGRARATTRRSTFRTVNRRMPWLIPGIRKNRTMNALIMMDQSGSMSDSWLAGLFSELDCLGALVDYDMGVFDCEVRSDEIQKVKRGKKILPLRTACGGTDFDAPIKYVNTEARGKYDCLIIMTDGGGPEPVRCNIPVLYILPAECELPFDAEHIRVKLEDN